MANPVFLDQVLFPAKDGVVWVGQVGDEDMLLGAEYADVERLLDNDVPCNYVQALIPRGPSMDDLESCSETLPDDPPSVSEDDSCIDGGSESSLSIISDPSDTDRDENDTEEDIDIETEDVDVSDGGEDGADTERDW